MSEEDLAQQVKELNKRIEELEGTLSRILEPVRNMQKATSGYIRLVSIVRRKGGITIDSILPDVKDTISKSIIQVLAEDNGQNISQLTESVRRSRGTASRRIIRERLKDLLEKELVVVRSTKRVNNYYLSDEVINKWSQLLSIPI